MTITIDGKTYYRTKEACLKAGLSKATFHRWLRQGIVNDSIIKDRRGWRLFSDEDVERIRKEVYRLKT